MFPLFSPTYWLLLGPCLLLSLWASWRVKRAFAKYSRVSTSSGMSGAEAAAEMLSRAGLAGRVSIERVQGFLSDHYDPRSKVLRLSPPVYEGRNLAAVGVACHEAGHALQDATHYAPLALRNAIVPTASIGSNLGVWLVILGAIFHSFNMAVIGLVLFAAVVVFQLVNLPVEFNASARAKQMMPQMGVIGGAAESRAVATVLDAAAMTYVAATITAVMELLYWAMLVFGGRRN
jgi:Zn-dependent membrane protease YugP